MSVLETAQQKLATTISTVYPSIVTAGRVYLPDSPEDWQVIAATNQVFIRIRPPQLVVPGVISTFAAYVDVCHRLYRNARQSADLLVTHLLSATTRSPGTSIQPTVYPMEGDGYWVMNVRYVLKVKSD